MFPFLQFSSKMYAFITPRYATFPYHPSHFDLFIIIHKVTKGQYMYNVTLRLFRVTTVAV
jgi:hypothetical protein